MKTNTILAAALAAAFSAPALAASPVVISQVYGGGGNSGATIKNDFIELFNRSDAAVDISGWSVQYASAAGTSWQVTKLSGKTVLQPGQYFLVQESAGTGGTVDLPTPDASGTLALSGTTGKVALVANGNALSGAAPAVGTFADLLGFGSAGYFEGSVGPGLSNTTAALRANGGCADTDNNGNDFTTGAPAPRNSASPLNACGVPQQPPIVATCPANLSLAFGINGGADISATDADGTVNSAVITSAAVPGISLINFLAATGAGGTATARLSIAASVQAGSYPVTIKFANDQSQDATCAISVSVAAPAAISHTIPQIQGPGNTSPYANTVQTTEGVVTAKVGSGFFIQDPDGDGNPLTSDGLFIFTTAANIGTVQVGDKIRISGSIIEYTPSAATRSYTEMQNVTAIVKLASGISITPTNIQLPYANLGQVEGMLVRFTNPLTVSQLEYLGDRGEVTLSSGRLEIASNRYRPRTPEAIAQAAANQLNQIILDDGIFVTPTVIPYLGEDGSLRAGDTVSGLTGVVDFGAKGGGGAAFKLQPTEAPVFSQDNPRTDPPVLAAGNVKVASANVLNYFTTFTNGTDVEGNSNVGCTLGSSTAKSNCRGADNLNEYVRQNTKIVGELKAINADVFGLMEIQNSGDYTVTKLVDSLNEAISPGTGIKTYAVVPKPAATGTDAIRVAMIYKPSALTPVGGALSDADAINNRPPMAQTFRANNGAKFTLVVNHLKSKGSCPSGTGADADQNDSQSCWNATRIQQANRLMNAFVPQVVAAAGDAKVLLIGDFNSYGMEDPIAAITATGFVNQLERFVRGSGGMPYSFVFNGESGYLDHALASAALSAQVVGAAEWHNNADEPPVVDYNTDGKPEDKFTSAPYRASDHDPVVISLNLAAPNTDVTASVKAVASGLVFARASNQWTGTLTITNTSGAALSGPLQLSLGGLPAGVTLVNASGNRSGVPYITANTSSLAAGASLTVPVTFSKTGTAAISYTTQVFSGTF
ncbi:ExeM/NucH family extracellular endonuclease [Pseudoduganella sp. FT26W]|uniref:ExeM/NucH family extracellular endonuclease n=1 Tax=Duganella aquatilis TaxID=2666082 RepID=A0A844CPK0_9BURK|nr:ExeM/NucH family extracellular endonuclease [Duganella aquatilis]MRW82627.1 ExeM/NucH family extracellular endonuclease [Duganella aquatilis]